MFFRALTLGLIAAGIVSSAFASAARAEFVIRFKHDETVFQVPAEGRMEINSWNSIARLFLLKNPGMIRADLFDFGTGDQVQVRHQVLESAVNYELFLRYLASCIADGFRHGDKLNCIQYPAERLSAVLAQVGRDSLSPYMQEGTTMAGLFTKFERTRTSTRIEAGASALEGDTVFKVLGIRTLRCSHGACTVTFN